MGIRQVWYLVTEDGRLVGLVSSEDGAETRACDGTKVGEVARRDFCVVREQSPLGMVCRTMRRQKASFALVASDGLGSPEDVKGLITSARIAGAVAEASEAFDDD